MTKSDQTLKTFVTFRIAGDGLVPDEVTELLKVPPAHAHAKGVRYSTGRVEILPTTGVWFFSTDRLSISKNWVEHLALALVVIGLVQRPQLSPSLPAEGELESVSRVLALGRFLQQKGLTATLSVFWHGAPQATEPQIPNQITDFLRLIPIQIETDFDRDEVASPRRSRAAA
jgi:hypothetical protein